MGAFPTRTALVFRLLLVIFLAILPLTSAAAADPAALTPPIGDGGRAYLAAVADSGAATGVQYFDPDLPAPPLHTDVDVTPPRRPEERSDPVDLDPWVLGVPFAVVLVVLLVVAFRSGGIRLVSFAPAPDRGARGGASLEPRATAVEPGPDSLEEIAGIADRQRALHLLLDRTLARAAAANGQRIGRSQTVRDVIRGLPSAWPLKPALGTIAAHAEIVQFGGRALTEEAFQSCLTAARPIFATPIFATPIFATPGFAAGR